MTTDTPRLAHLHSALQLAAGHIVHVTLSGDAANVMLLDDAGYKSYSEGAAFEHRAGGYFNRSPAILRPPHPGPWHVVVDLGGNPGEVRAAVTIRPG